MKPEVHGIQYGLSQDQLSFPVYRENDKKIYVPRFLWYRTIWSSLNVVRLQVEKQFR